MCSNPYIAPPPLVWCTLTHTFPLLPSLQFAEFDQIVRSDPENLASLVNRVASWLVRRLWKKAIWVSICAVKCKTASSETKVTTMIATEVLLNMNGHANTALEWPRPSWWTIQTSWWTIQTSWWAIQTRSLIYVHLTGRTRVFYFILSKPYAFANIFQFSLQKLVNINWNHDQFKLFPSQLFFCWSFFLSCFLQWGGRLLFEKILASFCRKLFAVTPSESKTRRGEGLCLFFCFDSFIKAGLPNHKECSTDTQSSGKQSTDTQSSGKQSTDQVEVCYSEFRGYSSRHAIANKPAWRGVVRWPLFLT